MCRNRRCSSTGTIADNIKYGKDDATEDEVEAAADTAQATEFITTMKEGFGSVISQGGTNVSGGQKQRLSIARALVRKPEIYLFDDSFSALDFKTDAKLRMALRKSTRELNADSGRPEGQHGTGRGQDHSVGRGPDSRHGQAPRATKDQ